MFHKIDLEGARAFVLAHADELQRARLVGILDQTLRGETSCGAKLAPSSEVSPRPPKEVVKALESVQRPDGGFPRGWAGGAPAADAPSSLDATAFLLDQLQDLPPLPGSPTASRALSYIRRTQQRDGSWSEEGAPWLTGEEGTAYLTANLTYTLATLDPTNRDPITWGLKWLERYDGPCDLHPSFLGWAAACRQRGTESPLALRYWERTQQALSQHGIEGSLEADDLDWLLSSALGAGIGGRYLTTLARLLQTLARRQQPDGGWPGGDRVHATLMALRVLRGFALI